jgi:hypothetical protein
MKQLSAYALAIFSWLLNPCYGQRIDVAELTLKIGGTREESFYHGFAEGDQLVFNFEEINDKELKEIEIIELPGMSRFMDFKTASIKDKTINIPRNGIYKFRFQNSSLRGRICRIRIQRIPAGDLTQNFNTNVFWRTVRDTTYTPVRERFVSRVDTIVTMLTNQVAKVSSTTAVNGNPNRNVIDVTLPEGTTSWSYYIGVGTEGKDAYESAKKNFSKTVGASLASLSGYDPTTLLALSGINLIDKVQGRDNVKYYFISDWNNAQLFRGGHEFLQYKQGDVVNDASQMKRPTSGKILLGLLNDNLMEPIEVFVRITAVQIRPYWDTRLVDRMEVRQYEEPYLKN